MDTPKKTYLQNVKDFVKAHQVAISVITTTAVVLKLNQRNMMQFNEFLAEKGLLDEFYTAVE